MRGLSGYAGARPAQGLPKRAFDFAVAASLLALLVPVIALVAVAIKLDSRGPVFFRCSRVGYRGQALRMLKFRKMYDGASGPPLTAAEDGRFTRVGKFLAASKLDEIPQLWNVLKGEMSLVGPRPEDHRFVALDRRAYAKILKVKPGITGLSQLAFSEESRILDPSDRISDYIERVLPQKMRMDALYAARQSLSMDARVLAWTAVAVALRQPVAVHRETGAMTLRRRPQRQRAVAPPPARERTTVTMGEAT
jgi:lipopolysaccharide/colanic/teichoic acid biosynthesis glycosyltransferase